MEENPLATGLEVVQKIAASGLGIHSQPRQDLYLSNAQLEAVLRARLKGLDLNLPLRTRSKAANSALCAALGYPVPKSFPKCEPRFPAQNFDKYVQKAHNLQIWNQEVSASRRYIVIHVDDAQKVTTVKVISGETLALLDTTGTLTQKYQAAAREAVTGSKLVADKDTPELIKRMASEERFLGNQLRFSNVLPVADVFKRLQSLCGTRIVNPGHEQERNRGAALHAAVQKVLGGGYSDSGQFPDIADQLVEVKLQTSPTIDLGLVSPDGTDPVAAIPNVRHCDVRYAVVYGRIDGAEVVLDHVIVSPGANFFTFFRRFEGKEINTKIQIPLPSDFFSDKVDSLFGR